MAGYPSLMARSALVLISLIAAVRSAAAQVTVGAPTGPTPQAPPAARIPLDRVVAVVGDSVILASDLATSLNQRRAQGLQLPTDSTGVAELTRKVIDELVDESVLVQRARTEKVEVSDADLAAAVDKQLKEVRGRYPSDAEFREDLKRAGIGSPDEYRRSLLDQARRQELQAKLIQKLKQDGKLVAVGVTDAEVAEFWERNKAAQPRRPAAVGFRQIVVAAIPSDKARAAARARADSLIDEIRRGGDFEQIAKRESQDSVSRAMGGDLGWNRRGQMVPAFDRMMFALNPGEVSPPVETTFGIHIIKVDRVQPAEVKARHILLRPKLDSSDVTAARLRADTVATKWRAGASFDSLVARYHDPAEDRFIDVFERAKLPVSYATAFGTHKAGDIVDPFRIEDQRRGLPKFVVAQITQVQAEGDYSLADRREEIRAYLSQLRGYRRLVEGLRKAAYVSIRL
ncbi:MAG: hypothetical protein NVS1B4_17580 [Gemmatimonadaceae bacterium]